MARPATEPRRDGDAFTGPSLEACVRAALTPPEGLALGVIVPRAAGTFVVVEGADPEAARALPPVLEALAAAGIPPGRVTVAAASPPEGVAFDRAACAARLLAAAPGSSRLVHDAGRAHPFAAGRVDGIAIELDDALLEAEALIVLGAVSPDRRLGFSGGARLVVPGLASRATRAALAARLGVGGASGASADRSDLAAAGALVGVDAMVCWTRTESGAWRAWSGAGDAADRAARAWHRAARRRS